MPNPVVHFEIIGADGSALQSFHRDLFDWRIGAENEWQYGMVETGGEGGINGGISGDQDGSARVSVYAAVDDLQSYLDKAERLGATVVMPVTELTGTAVTDNREATVQNGAIPSPGEIDAVGVDRPAPRLQHLRRILSRRIPQVILRAVLSVTC